MDEVYTYLVDLPDGIDEMVTPCLDGYTGYIDKNLSWEQQKKEYDHIVAHLSKKHFEESNVQKAECEAHEV